VLALGGATSGATAPLAASRSTSKLKPKAEAVTEPGRRNDMLERGWHASGAASSRLHRSASRARLLRSLVLLTGGLHELAAAD
jgi:hypothetical protein